MNIQKLILTIAAIMSLGTLMAQSATPVAKASVVQNETTVESAQFRLSKNPTFIFGKDGTVFMTLDKKESHAAQLPLKENSHMEVVFSTLDESANKREAAVSSAGYGTFFSAFQTIVPEGSIEVYAPTYYNGKLLMNQSTRLAPGTILPAETGVLLKNVGDYAFAYSDEAAEEVPSVLTGSAIELPVTDFEGTIYSLAKKNGIVAFYRYTAPTTKAGKAFLVLDGENSAKEIAFDLDSDATDIAISSSSSDKPVEMFNTAGQKVGNNYKGVIISGGKKYLNR